MTNAREVTQRLKHEIGQVGGAKTESLLTEITIGIAAYASTMTPVMTSNLINSQYRNVRRTPDGWKGTVGYGAKYATYVHEAPGTLLGKSVMRDKDRPGWGNVWDPSGEPEFLKKGAEQYATQDLAGAIRRAMSL